MGFNDVIISSVVVLHADRDELGASEDNDIILFVIVPHIDNNKTDADSNKDAATANTMMPSKHPSLIITSTISLIIMAPTISIPITKHTKKRFHKYNA